MTWLPALLWALGMLLRWLLNQKTLSDRERRRLNNLTYRMRQVQTAAVARGCLPTGLDDPAAEEEGTEEIAVATALPQTRDALRPVLLAGIDRILGYRWFLSTDERKLLEAQRKTYVEDDEAVDRVLLRILLQNKKEPPC